MSVASPLRTRQRASACLRSLARLVQVLHLRAGAQTLKKTSDLPSIRATRFQTPRTRSVTAPALAVVSPVAVRTRVTFARLRRVLRSDVSIRTSSALAIPSSVTEGAILVLI
jgi:hypothetical protein